MGSKNIYVLFSHCGSKKKAWQCISPAVTVKDFKKCCICNVVDGADGDMLWNGSEGDGNVGS